MKIRGIMVAENHQIKTAPSQKARSRKKLKKYEKLISSYWACHPPRFLHREG